jgi:hypothetical protein
MAKEFTLQELDEISSGTLMSAKSLFSWKKAADSSTMVEDAAIWKLPNGRYVVILEGCSRGDYIMPKGCTMVARRKNAPGFPPHFKALYTAGERLVIEERYAASAK